MNKQDMEWSDIYDPAGVFVFKVNWDRLGYLAEEIQGMIDQKGVEGMFKAVNDNYKHASGHKALKYGHVNSLKAIVDHDF